VPSRSPGTVLSWHTLTSLSLVALQSAALVLLLLRVKVMKTPLKWSWALVLDCIRGFLELNNDPRNTAKREKDHSPFIGLAT